MISKKMDAETLIDTEVIKPDVIVWRLSEEVCERLQAFDGLKSIPR